MTGGLTTALVRVMLNFSTQRLMDGPYICALRYAASIALDLELAKSEIADVAVLTVADGSNRIGRISPRDFGKQ